MTPQANGLAERFVGIIKGRVGSYLVHAKMSLKYWYWACMQAAAVIRLTGLNIRLTPGAPTFGDSVVVRRPEKEKTNFQEKGAVGTFLHWSSVVPMGAWVLMTRDNGSNKIELASLPRWKLTRDPNSNVAVWVDQNGEVCFDQPEEGSIMTFEERKSHHRELA